MIIKKTYNDGDYAIFELLDINYELDSWWLKGLVLDTNVPNIDINDTWQFELAQQNDYEVLEV